MKYALVGILLLLAAVGLYCATQGEDGPEETVATAPLPDAGAIQRQTRMQPEFEIPEEEPDLGQPDLGQPEQTMRTVRQPRTCDGDLDVAGVRRVAQQQRRQVRSCYERRLKVNNVLQGTVNVNLVVGRDGRVDQVRVGGSLRDSEVFSCVRRLAQSWRFPAVTGGSCAQVSIPFAMTPRP